ncbi:unnamed protein product [Linum trigynum]|uniref:Uncharacterized protein n=1 Tax=Linum trigynum TaxID=586398 RepID=A0AAV2GPZ7_9ROSI
MNSGVFESPTFSQDRRRPRKIADLGRVDFLPHKRLLLSSLMAMRLEGVRREKKMMSALLRGDEGIGRRKEGRIRWNKKLERR